MTAHLSANHRLGSSLPKQLVIVRSLPGVGDLLCIVPALRALRAALPETHITLLGLKQAIWFVQRFNHYINAWLEFPGYPGIPEVPFSSPRTVSFLEHIQKMNLDLALQLHGNGSSINSFTMLLGATLTAGFFPTNQYCPDRDHFFPYPEHEPEVWRHLRLLEFLGIPLQGDSLEFPLWESDWQEFTAIASAHNLRKSEYICIHPGASTSTRRWPAQHFAVVADILAAQGFQIVLTGTLPELELTQTIAQAMQFPAINLAGQTSLGAIAILLKQSQLLICNDTGISHLAAALKTKSVVIFTNSDSHRWAPLDRQRHRIVESELLQQGRIQQDCLQQDVLNQKGWKVRSAAQSKSQPKRDRSLEPDINTTCIQTSPMPDQVLTEVRDLLRETAYAS